MDNVTNAIAVLGVYFALMAVLAVAVEAVITWFKIPVPWLQGKPSPEDVLNEVRSWLPQDEQEAQEARINALNKALDAIGEATLAKDVTGTQIAETVGKATTKYVKQERNRRAIIRAIAIVLGIVFAVIFQIDTLDVLGPLYGSALQPWQDRLSADTLHAVGLVLSGLAASAGSSFWHDQSARLRGLKSASEAVGQVGG
jgi:hypothetical protein